MPDQDADPNNSGCMLSKADRAHLEEVIGIITKAKSAGLVAIMNGTVPDAGDAYVIATEATLVTDFYSQPGRGE